MDASLKKNIMLMICSSFIALQGCAPFEFKNVNAQVQQSSSTSSGVRVEIHSSFDQTLKPVLRNQCSSCHGQGQSPEFAVESSGRAVSTLLDYSLVDFDNPHESKLVQKLLEGHNSFGDEIAYDLAVGIEDWTKAIFEEQ